ncbi:hypothetical protein BJ138DRAFT_1104900 [Hygrophoropsis aurantiaca]|uniref:Uncharacterized protein n=1 Tax=Hygrophoropsis aurantiaca TaxID=72124 RepID=A0ACB8A279_9AGAM|nr:hypothetical protein BJ138DRAFT_1104900 [Hygrophoropsis aurantiaca]
MTYLISMPPQSWTTPEQEAFLLLHKNDFLKAQLQARTPSFFQILDHEWFQKFPEKDVLFPGVPELTEEQKIRLGKAVETRKKQIKNYLRNHSHTKGRAVLSVTKTVNKMLTDKAKGARGPTTNEVAMKMLYREEVQPIIRAGIESGLYVTPGDKLMAVRTLTAEALEKAGPSIKAEALAQKLSSSKRQSKHDVSEEPLPRTNYDYARAQADFPIVAGQWCEAMESLTGCSFSIFMGGPDPHLDGEINVVSYHTGASESGTTFSQAVKDFDKRFTIPWSDFLSSVYPASTRKLRAIDAVVNDQSATPSDSLVIQKPSSTLISNPSSSSLPDTGLTDTGLNPGSSLLMDMNMLDTSSTSPFSGVQLPANASTPSHSSSERLPRLSGPRPLYVPMMDFGSSEAPEATGSLAQEISDPSLFSGLSSLGTPDPLFDVSSSFGASYSNNSNFSWDDPQLPPYTFPTESNESGLRSSAPLYSPIRAFVDEMSGRQPLQMTPPRLRYSMANDPSLTLPQPTMSSLPPIRQVSAQVSLPPTWPVSAQALNPPKPRPRPIRGNAIGSQYDGVFGTSTTDSPKPSGQAPSEAQTSGPAMQPADQIALTPPVKQVNPGVTATTKKRKQPATEPSDNDASATCDDSVNSRHRSTRAIIPSSRQDEANKIGDANPNRKKSARR